MSALARPSQGGPIAIIGGGRIGMAFAIVFARAGRHARVFEADAGRRADVLPTIRARLEDLGSFDLLDEAVDTVLARVQVVDRIEHAVEGATYVQECASERLDIKRALFAELDELASAGVALASASSAITASAIAADLPGRTRALVTHPGNPPYLIPVIEIVPAPFTDPAVAAEASAFLSSVGLQPVAVRKEVEGFVFNRLQGALLREAYCLVRDGVASVDDVDKIVRDGLGLRWSLIGPFETADLNVEGGITAHSARMGEAYRRMGQERGQDDPWTADLVAKVDAERRAMLPLKEWGDRVAWRDRRLMALIRARRKEAGE
jgi:3-hydroxyacyl-CoA dehydrogenase